MPARFRKTINLGSGVKLNVNKKSMSVSAGPKGARYTMSSTGRRTSSVGIQGKARTQFEKILAENSTFPGIHEALAGLAK